MPRHESRRPDELRPVRIQHRFTKQAAGSVLIEFGDTVVLCTASIEASLPAWRMPRNEGDPVLGWVTAEYNMLPGSTAPRKSRDRLKVDGRTTEIQRLIGRSLRAVVDFRALGRHLVTVDCDVLQADGGTRTASITGGFLALRDAIATIPSESPILTDSVAAISVGVIDGVPMTDLNYQEDSRAEVDMNVVMTGSGRFVEVQGTAEGEPFDGDMLSALLALAQSSICELTRIQAEHR